MDVFVKMDTMKMDKKFVKNVLTLVLNVLPFLFVYNVQLILTELLISVIVIVNQGIMILEILILIGAIIVLYAIPYVELVKLTMIIV